MSAVDPGIALREATVDDVPTLLALVRDLAVYERAPDAVKMTEDDLRAALFGAAPLARAVLAEDQSGPLGFAIWFTSFSTWTGRGGLYLEDLFVTPEARGRGIGSALLRHLACEAVSLRCARLEWSVLDWNASAIDFYKSLGAEALEEWTRYRLSGDALSAVAA